MNAKIKRKLYQANRHLAKAENALAGLHVLEEDLQAIPTLNRSIFGVKAARQNLTDYLIAKGWNFINLEAYR
jgi:hypothetical protein